MSTYSIDILDSEKYQKEFEDNIIYSFEQYIYKEHFRLGNGIDEAPEDGNSYVRRNGEWIIL
jgi:hypothetical protein